MVVHYCPKCGEKLYSENDVNRYYSREGGCFLFCDTCHLRLIGVDLSVCAKCERSERSDCKKKYCTIVKGGR